MVRVLSVPGISASVDSAELADGVPPPDTPQRVYCKDPCWIYPPGFDLDLLCNFTEEDLETDDSIFDRGELL